MKASKVYYKRLFNLGGYENEEIGGEMELLKGESVTEAVRIAKEHVLRNNTKQNEKIEHYKEVLSNPKDYNYDDILEAKAALEKSNNPFNKL